MARDGSTGELGVAVQSHWFSVGPLCAWARAGVGGAQREAAPNAEVAVNRRRFDDLMIDLLLNGCIV